MFGRVHVDINQRRIDGKKQAVNGIAAVIKHVRITLLHRVGNDLVPNHPAVDEKELLISLAAGISGQPDPATQLHAVALF